MENGLILFGDSNTWGYDPRSFLGERYEKDSRWPDLLAARTGRSILNLGENGRLIPTDSRELFPLLTALRQSEGTVLVMLGTNDLLAGRSPRRIAGDMENFLEALQNALPDTRVLLLSPPRLADPALEGRNRILRSLLRNLGVRRGIPFCPAGEWPLPLAWDGVHLAEAGHRLFARQLSDWLESENL